MVTLDKALQYKHYGEIYKGVDMRGEVGLLNRNIVVTGDQVQDFGAHMMFLQGSDVVLYGVEVTIFSLFNHKLLIEMSFLGNQSWAVPSHGKISYPLPCC